MTPSDQRFLLEYRNYFGPAFYQAVIGFVVQNIWRARNPIRAPIAELPALTQRKLFEFEPAAMAKFRSLPAVLEDGSSTIFLPTLKPHRGL